jgi:hypothetical protein
LQRDIGPAASGKLLGIDRCDHLIVGDGSHKRLRTMPKKRGNNEGSVTK